MSDKDISLDIETKIAHVDNEPHVQCDILLKYQDDYLDPDENLEVSKNIQRIVSEKYWNILCGFLSNYKPVVRVSGIHFNILEFLDLYSHTQNYANNIICHYHQWKVIDEDAVDEEKFALIECRDSLLLKNIFEKYWFTIGAEWQTEIFLLKDECVAQIEPWSRKTDNEQKFKELLDICVFLFDNMHNGFHCKVTSNKENESSLKNRIRQ
ncbi:hypothetical protein VU01_10494 [Candidatus Electrothrix marina]|uniref:Uncharacterized protein n=1 Tax=Candidatus Electrothrix marina TaxID=1859130 RepID=A0A3S3RX80_9BACT|nr:hypothetical protein VU00_10272 [Candidatus Electrothrix marina]RWX52025.1 hypothetical protein VU01_10494 [Candidatus Electrothrix marina]